MIANISASGVNYVSVVLTCVTVVAAILIIDLNYRFFFKAVLDFLFALICVILTSPALIALAVISKKRTGKALESKAYLGVKGKIIFIHTFAGTDKGIKKLAYLFDILGGRLSFVGISLMPVSDGAFLDDNQMGRFSARPGIINHLAIGGDENLSWEESFALDEKYRKKCELFRDIAITIVCAVYAVRGERGAYLGETKRSYSEVLLERGKITNTDIENSIKLEKDALSEREKAREFKKQRYR